MRHYTEPTIEKIEIDNTISLALNSISEEHQNDNAEDNPGSDNRNNPFNNPFDHGKH